MFADITSIIRKIKQDKPLVLTISNGITMDFVANGLLSVGASPVISTAEQEMEELIQLASVLVINLGNLNTRLASLCNQACAIAQQLHKPIILDPVGAGASHYRT